MKHLHYNKAKLVLHHNLLPLSIYKKFDILHKNKYNVEHIIPQSLDKSVNSDLHILFLSHNVINSLRNNYRFVDFVKYDDLYFEYIYIKNNQVFVTNCCNNIPYYAAFNHKKRLFVPPNESKGIIARSLLYYQNKYKKYGICNKMISEDLMYKWNDLYKVYEDEYLRNLQIEKFQNNRNPFIFH